MDRKKIRGEKQVTIRRNHDTQVLKICIMAEGGVCFHYIDESANAVEGKNKCLLSEVYGIVWVKRRILALHFAVHTPSTECTG
jgi:hypothetical protein